MWYHAQEVDVTQPFLLGVLRAAEPGLLSLRLLSAVLTAAAVLVAVRAVRRAVSARAALFMLAFCASAPLLLLYTRTGLYMSASLLHEFAIGS